MEDILLVTGVRTEDTPFIKMVGCSASHERPNLNSTPIYNIDLYEDVSGRYFPKLDDPASMYLERKDGRVEIVRFAKDGSNGRIIKDHRGRLLKRRVKG